jgi:argininosuccinate synthase
MARPIIAKKLVEIAQKEGAKYICHGATGKGNDQVRFESAVHALDPKLKIIAPWRRDDWEFKSREDLLEFAKEYKIPVDQSKKKIYSRDENIWHISHEGGELEDPWNEFSENIHVLSKPVTKTPDTAKYLTIGFNKGVPVSIDGKKMASVKLIEELNKLGSKYGIGTIDIVENRLVGMKSRGVYETPGGTILYAAHKALEKLVLDRDEIAEKNKLSIKYAELVYDGKWFTPLREAIDAFADRINESVTGEVRMKLYKGHALPSGTKSKNSLYSEEFATFGEDDVYNQKDADGFINLFSLSMKIRALNKKK